MACCFERPEAIRRHPLQLHKKCPGERTFEGGFMLFGRKKKEKEKTSYKVESENLAIPEVHIGETNEEEPEPEREENITYENVAIPEIHIYRKKK